MVDSEELDSTLPTEVYALVDGNGELYAVPYASITPSYGVGTSNLDIFRGVVYGLPYGTHYIYFRQDQYNYCLIYGRNLSLSGNTFSGSECYLVTYNTYYSSGGQPTYSITGPNTYSISVGSVLVYSDLGHYPRLIDERGYYLEAICVGLGVFTFTYFLGRIRSSLRL